MDGVKRRLNASLQRKLSCALSLAILLVALLAGAFSGVAAFDEAHELQDGTLQQIAALFDRQRLAPLPAPTPAPGGAPGAERDEDARVIVQPYLAAHAPAAASVAAAPLRLPAGLADGLYTLDVGGAAYRVLVNTTALGERIAVTQPTAVRDEVARDSALRTVMPILILMPILLLIVADLVRKLFRPIAALSAEIDQRAEHELHPVPVGHLAAEVRPFVLAINRLLLRVAGAIDGQRRFVADAAHELRSPLTALSLQAERLADAEMGDAARARVATLRRGVVRAQNLLEQLLALAKAQAATERPRAPLSVQGVYRRVLEDFLPLAEARQIDIGVVGEHDVQLWADDLDLVTLVKNLVDNAIRHTPPGGKVDLDVVAGDGGALLSIRDTGPGIAVAERERVFDPFYRILGGAQPGSGLGLAIVKAIADRMGAQVCLGYADTARQSGLSVEVRMPVAAERRR